MNRSTLNGVSVLRAAFLKFGTCNKQTVKNPDGHFASVITAGCKTAGLSLAFSTQNKMEILTTPDEACKSARLEVFADHKLVLTVSTNVTSRDANPTAKTEIWHSETGGMFDRGDFCADHALAVHEIRGFILNWIHRKPVASPVPAAVPRTKEVKELVPA